jgi:hypothetical protein
VNITEILSDTNLTGHGRVNLNDNVKNSNEYHSDDSVNITEILSDRFVLWGNKGDNPLLSMLLIIDNSI